MGVLKYGQRGKLYLKATFELRRLLRDARKECGFSSRQVAEKLGISYTAIYNYESGLRRPSPSMLTRLAEIYGKPADYFCDREPQSTWQNIFARNLRYERKRSEVSQTALSKITGISLASIKALEDEDSYRLPSQDELEKLARALMMEPEDLLGDGDTQETLQQKKMPRNSGNA